VEISKPFAKAGPVDRKDVRTAGRLVLRRAVLVNYLGAVIETLADMGPS
jgi:hypothetical protein